MNVSDSLKTGIDVTLSEALGFGGMTTVVGLAIVFGVLLILMIVLYLFKVIFYKDQNKSNNISELQKPRQAQAPAVAEEDEEELVAVLTAAVAATLKTSTNRVRINTYKRVHTDPPVWNRAGRKEAMENKL